MKYLYKYPQKKYPYEKLVEETSKKSRLEPEYELTDTGIFDDDRYFDIYIEMAKPAKNEEELLFRVTAYNRGPEPAPLHIIPQIFFRNTWSWGNEDLEKQPIPNLSKNDNLSATLNVDHWKLGGRHAQFSPSPGINENDQDIEPELLFTNNETNYKKLWGEKNKSDFVKDAFHDYIVDSDEKAVNPKHEGTKAAAWYAFNDGDGIPSNDYVTVRFKFTNGKLAKYIDEEAFDKVFEKRQREADDFYWSVSPLPMPDDVRAVQRQAFSGLLWTKQFYHFVHAQWYNGDPNNPPPPADRKNVRNQAWQHLYIDDILSLPDKWEYPFFAAWDTAFHCIPLAMIDAEFAKKQLDLLTREWYMHPNGQIPAYEWNFSDVNPPVHAWAAYRTFKIERKMYGIEDIDFLERVFQKLLLNFTWWVNRKDKDGKNVFEGGFLGLDNIGIFNRSEPLPTGGVLEQADSTGWMAFFCLQMLNISLELAKTRPVYEDIASKFFEHFLFIADAMTYNSGGGVERSLWDEEDNFYYDAISYGGPWSQSLPVRSLVGLIPLYASLTLEPEMINKFPSFKKRLEWFIEKRSDISSRNIADLSSRGVHERLLLALVDKDRLIHILERMLDEEEFLSDYGIRSLSKFHNKNPFSMDVNGEHFVVDYVPGDSNSGLFGGNSNWRGPIWFPTNFLLIESLQRFYLYYGPDLKVECPKNSGTYLNLAQVADELQHRLIDLFLPDDDKFGARPCNGENDTVNYNENFRDHVFFYEFFDGDTGRGLGSSHQCGWTALVAKMIHDTGVSMKAKKAPRTPRSIAATYLDDVDIRKPKPFSPGSVLQRRKSAHSIFSGHGENESNGSITTDGIPVENIEQALSQFNLLSKKDSYDANSSDEEEQQQLLERVKSAIESYKSRVEDSDDSLDDELEAKN